MALQFIHDSNGNTTGVFIPIEQWQELKIKYTDLQNEEASNIDNLADWQKKIINERLEEYRKNPGTGSDFDKSIDDIEKGL